MTGFIGTLHFKYIPEIATHDIVSTPIIHYVLPLFRPTTVF